VGTGLFLPEVDEADLVPHGDVELRARIFNRYWDIQFDGERLMIRRLTFGILATTILVGAASCGGGTGSSGGTNAAPPTAPTVPSPQPPAIAVGFTDQLVGWSGQVSSTEGGMSSCRLALQQNGSQVSGRVVITTSDSGDLTGNTLQGNVTATSCNGDVMATFYKLARQ
jgi:hypothetical protein